MHLAFIVTLASSAHVAAQTAGAKLMGRVIDEANRDPIAGAAIRIGEIIVLTDRMGRFLTTLPQGILAITVERIGYATRQDTIRIASNVTSDLEIRLSKKPVPLPALTVVSRSEWLESNGLFERRDKSGLHGRYILREEIERRAPTVLTDLFNDVPGAKVQYFGIGKRLIRFNREPPGGLMKARSPYIGCDPAVFVDGRRHLDRAPTADPAVDDFNFLSPLIIEAIEIYVGSAPIEFRSECGSIVIWTRRGGGL